MEAQLSTAASSTETYRRVEISWLDHWEPEGGPWHNIKDLISKARPAPIRTVGFLLYEDDDILIVAATVDDEHVLVGNCLYLLKIAVVSIDDLM
jgi:hypothetical protein